MVDLQPGTRAVIRYSLSPGAEAAATDALGLVTGADAEALTVTTKNGPVRITRESIIAAHEVPPAPTRPGKTHEIVSAVDLRRISAAAWLPTDVSWLHAENLRHESAEVEVDLLQKGWLLRASASVTKRANSVLPVSATGLDPAQSLDAVEAWYSARDAAPCIQIYSAEDSSALAETCSPLTPLFAERGWRPSAATLALTGPTAEAAAGISAPAQAAAPGLRIEVTEMPTPTHYSAWTAERDPGSLEALRGLVEAEDPCQFVTAYAEHPDGSSSLVATCRVVERHKWGVITNLVTRPDLRRRGAGRSVIRATAALLARRGVRSYLAEVEAANAASLGLFRSLGAGINHRYWYASPGS